MQSFTVRMPLLVATSAFGLERRRWSSPQQCYLHCLRTLCSYLTSVVSVILNCWWQSVCRAISLSVCVHVDRRWKMLLYQ